jgi:ABC-type polysaccharide/polyol phosphate transport system ATPase subunit
MSPKGAIAASHVWKRFRADRQRRLLRDEFQRLQALLAGRGRRGWRWALRDVDFVAEPGQSVGLVGSNGSGKTTLLKILSRVMYPYAGHVEVSGRVGALIEVRAGIHPDLTGRENVFLYGTLLGLPRAEVAKRFDEIVAFAELDDAIDRQVKFYSTGMQMRLGFAVAAFLEPDVLLVDEVLAVGDVGFQQKCLDRMRQVLALGTTLILVSHDLAAVESICGRALWLEDGEIRADGTASSVLAAYRRSVEEQAGQGNGRKDPVRLSVDLVGADGSSPRTGEPLEVRVVARSDQPRRATLFLGISEGTAAATILVSHDLQLTRPTTSVLCRLESLPLPRGRFSIWAGAIDPDGHELLAWHPVCWFDVVGPSLEPAPRAVVRLAHLFVRSSWESQDPVVPDHFDVANATGRAESRASG